jgi:glycosyltransferase involved in cell wall biosynthesis
MIKVLHVVDSLGLGGVTRSVTGICNSADFDRYEVSIISLQDHERANSTARDGLHPNVKFYSINYDFDPEYSLPAFFRAALLESTIRRKARDFLGVVCSVDPDILHFHTLPRELNLGPLARRICGCSLVYTDHSVRIGNDEYKPHVRVLLSYIYRQLYKPFHLIAVSSSVADCIRRFDLQARGKHLATITNGVNTSEFRPISTVDRDAMSVIYLARISPVKGHQELIDAWHQMNASPKHRLRLVGPNELGDSIVEHAEQNGCKNIEFTGPRDDVIDLLQKADIGVFPSRKEGLPLALLEMMATALPVVVSNIPELASVVTDNHDGMIYRSGDPADLAAKLQSLMRDPALRRRLGGNARRTVIERYSSDNLAGRVEAFYRHILKDELEAGRDDAPLSKQVQ